MTMAPPLPVLADVVIKLGSRNIRFPYSILILLAATLPLEAAVILPANPGFYTRPSSIDQVIDFIVARVLDQIGIPNTLMARWGRDDAGG